MLTLKRTSGFALGLLLAGSLRASADACVSPIAVEVIKPERPQSDLIWAFTGKFKPETFYGHNVSFLNDTEDLDRTFYIRHTLDFNLHIDYGFKTYCEKVAEMHMNIRNKGIWGNPRSIALTTDADVKVDEAVVGAHKHHIPRHIFWMREGWLNINLNRALSVGACNTHWLKIGAFSFQLGRGIALGDAFSVGQDFIGFYSDSAIDQYAFGANLNGQLWGSALTYDFYAALLRNNSNGLADTAAKVMGQEYGRRDCPERGFGKINFVVAGRTVWTPFSNDCCGTLTLEPYWLYNSDPEQKVDFDFDASSKLGTFGLAGEYIRDRFECGFDTAVNVGSQSVRGWDRNAIQLKNRNGKAYFINSHVVAGVDPLNPGAADVNLYKVPYATTVVAHDGTTQNSKELQKIVWSADQTEAQNGKQIGTSVVLQNTSTLEALELPYGAGQAINTANPVPLFNTKDRFRNAYKNDYRGWMFIGDAAYWFRKDRLRVAFMGGVASGDNDPNVAPNIDGRYDGFIGLQEGYCGDRVKSVFVLGGSGKLKRPLSFISDPTVQPDDFDSFVSGFTDLALAGGSLFWQSPKACKPYDVHANILGYWFRKQKPAFDAVTGLNADRCASRFMGTEFNVLTRVKLFKNLKLIGVASFFVPGYYYSDIKGKPFNKDQKKALDGFKDAYKEVTDREDVSGFEDEALPNVGTDLAYTLNVGLEFTF